MRKSIPAIPALPLETSRGSESSRKLTKPFLFRYQTGTHMGLQDRKYNADLFMLTTSLPIALLINSDEKNLQYQLPCTSTRGNLLLVHFAPQSPTTNMLFYVHKSG